MPNAPDDELTRVEGRLTELEVRYSHQQKLMRDLSDVVYQQRQELDGLKERLLALERKGEFPELERPTDPSDEVPPHY